MKYEVIGWMDCGCYMYPKHNPITASVDAAIIKAIRKYGYLFGGDAHEDHCPVLNDGTYVSYSWRGWGRIIALAYDKHDKYDYMLGYMDMNIKPSARKYPDEWVDDDRIVPKESLTETFVMRLADDMFEKMKAGTKTMEIRLFDEKRQKVDIGDYIEFRKVSDENERIIRRVADLEIWESFKRAFDLDYYDDKKTDKRLRYSAERLGFPADSDLQSIVEGMYKYYTKEQEEKHGVIAFSLEEPKHRCSISLNIISDSAENIKFLNDKVAENRDDYEECSRLSKDFYDIWELNDALEEISENILKRYSSLVLAHCYEYDRDVNIMIRKLLKDFFGKEQKLKEISERFCKYINLDIYAVIAKDSEEPKQNLALDKDIVEFLDKSGVKLNITCKEVGI